MSEIINTYPINDPETLIPMDRAKFYEEQTDIFKKAGKPTSSIDIMDIFIFNTKGEALLQKRSMDKSHNAGLIDKSLGGHIQYGDTVEYTVMVETVQELHTPSIVLKNKKDFDKTHALLKDYIATIALIKHIATETHTIANKIKDEYIDISKRVHMYFGFYDGRIKPSDGEAQGVLWYKLSDLEKEMEQFPDIFTKDIHFLLKEYRKEIDEFLALLS